MLDEGCCGLAGNFGFEDGHYEVSTACAERGLMPAVRAASDDTTVLADGYSCRTQIRQLDNGGHEPTHLARLAADDVGPPASCVRFRARTRKRTHEHVSAKRPGVLRWLAYAFGARLPVTYGDWVLHDLTARTWFLRQLARTAVQCLPAALLALLPGRPGCGWRCRASCCSRPCS